MNELCVAAAQAVSSRGAVEANLERHCRLAERAAAEGVEVLVFPELSATGYELDVAPKLAFAAGDDRLEPVLEVAAASQVVLSVGAPIRLDSGLHIGAFVIEPDRSARIYTKRHLFGDEKAVFEPGDRDPLLDLGDDRAVFAICADTSHPEHAAAAAERGASLYLAGVFFDPESYPTSAARLSGYAAGHAMAVVMANAGGPATGFEAAGRSAVWSDSGALVACLDGLGPGLAVARRSAAGWTGEAMAL